MNKFCLCCERPLHAESAPFTEFDHWYPLINATIWRTPGNYGSMVFDPDGPEFLEAYICDYCLRERAGMGLLFKVTPQSPLPVKVKGELLDLS